MKNLIINWTMLLTSPAWIIPYIIWSSYNLFVFKEMFLHGECSIFDDLMENNNA